MSTNYYASGQWEFYCDLCGRKSKSSDARKTWDGFYVCSSHKEVRNPQDFLRGVKDDQHVPWSRPGGTDTFVNNSALLLEDGSYLLSESGDHILLG